MRGSSTRSWRSRSETKWRLCGEGVCFGVGIIHGEETAASKEILSGAIKYLNRRELSSFRKGDFEDLAFTERLRGLKQQAFSAKV